MTIGQGAEKYRHHAITQHPHRADQKTVLRIVDRQLTGDLRSKTQQDIAVHLGQQVDHHQRRKDGTGTLFPEHSSVPLSCFYEGKARCHPSQGD
ncbi:hypothetical protein D3C85_1483460 [compost metagenome]